MPAYAEPNAHVQAWSFHISYGKHARATSNLAPMQIQKFIRPAYRLIQKIMLTLMPTYSKKHAICPFTS